MQWTCCQADVFPQVVAGTDATVDPALRCVTDEQIDEHRDNLLDVAARLGFVLVNYPTPHGQMIWEWRNGDGPRPQFVTERVARDWMAEWIERTTPARPDVVAEARRARESTQPGRNVAESA